MTAETQDVSGVVGQLIPIVPEDSEKIETICIEIPVSPGILSDNSLEDVDDSEIESLFDNPVESKLRKQLERKIKLIEQHKEKLQRKRQQVEALSKENDMLKNKLKQLMGKNQEHSQKPESGDSENHIDAPGTIKGLVGNQLDDSTSSSDISDESEVEYFKSSVETKLRMRLKQPVKELAATAKKMRSLQKKKQQVTKENAELEKKVRSLKRKLKA